MYWLLAGLLLGLVGCDGGISDEFAAQFQTSKQSYNRGEAIRAVYVNRAPQTVYIHWGCLPAQLERRGDGRWGYVPLNIVCAQIVRSPLTISPQASFDIKIAGRYLADLEVDAGTYRLVVHVSWSKDGEPRRVVSNRFTIVQRDL